MLNLNNIHFRSNAISENGEVNDQTIFHYRQKEDIVWGTYEGGEIRFGTFSGFRNEDELEFRYQHQNVQGDFKTGKCHTIIHEVKGRLELHEEWEWTCGDFSKGTSTLEEINKDEI